jgi:dynein assembly factor 1
MELTTEYLKEMCKTERMKNNDIYTTPELNDKLYLHYKGFRKIQALEAYTALKVLWLEGNGIGEISGLDKQTMLRTLYLHENCIDKMQGLESLVDLDTLNLCKNFITKIEGLEKCTKLTSLLLAHNNLLDASDLEHILKLPSLMTLDIQHNRINDINIMNILSQMPDLRVLYLMGNPVVKLIKYYRKTIISKCPNLKYLDDRPIFDDERRRVNRWSKVYEETGDYEKALEAERDEINLIRDEKRALEQENFRNFDKMVREGLITRMKNEEEMKAKNNNDENNINLENIEEKLTGITPHEENPELKAFREERLNRIMNPESSKQTSKKKNGEEEEEKSSSSFFTPGAGADDEKVNEFKSLLQEDIWPEFDQTKSSKSKETTKSANSLISEAPVLPPPPPPSATAAVVNPSPFPPPPPPAQPSVTSSLSSLLPPPPPTQRQVEASKPLPPGNTDFDELD